LWIALSNFLLSTKRFKPRCWPYSSTLITLTFFRRSGYILLHRSFHLFGLSLVFCVSLRSLSRCRPLAVAGALIGPWPWRTSEVSLGWP
jgi:putative component of membrane protein insertase Oxa1/YidC/SpoIIIJ protein YidD